MNRTTKTALAASFGAALMTSLASPGLAQQTQLTAKTTMSFEHVMNIGTQGTGEGQFKYVEDFALSIDGPPAFVVRYTDV